MLEELSGQLGYLLICYFCEVIHQSFYYDVAATQLLSLVHHQTLLFQQNTAAVERNASC